LGGKSVIREIVTKKKKRLTRGRCSPVRVKRSKKGGLTHRGYPVINSGGFSKQDRVRKNSEGGTNSRIQKDQHDLSFKKREKNVGGGLTTTARPELGVKTKEKAKRGEQKAAHWGVSKKGGSRRKKTAESHEWVKRGKKRTEPRTKGAVCVG